MTDILSRAELIRLGAPPPAALRRDPAEEAEIQRILAAARLAGQLILASGRPHTTDEAMAVFDAVQEGLTIPPMARI